MVRVFRASRKEKRYTKLKMPIFQELILKDYTSLRVGGISGPGRIVESTTEAIRLCNAHEVPEHVLGFGSNSLVSDHGLPGTLWLMHGGEVDIRDTQVIADAGCWWDDVVQQTIEHGLWGFEMMSGIPGSVGAAVVGNIAAYGQAVADTLTWVDVYDTRAHQQKRLSKNELQLGYRYSCLQEPSSKDLIVLRASFELSRTPIKDVTYQTVLNIAQEHHFSMDHLADRREATIATREKADSLYDYRHPDLYPKTAGSFFRNPEVDRKTAEYVMSFDETGLSLERLQSMNQVHSGGHRVSAAHVLLAAGFSRGQTWGEVRLNKDHILKLENAGNATAQDIYNVAMQIVRTVRDRLRIDLVPEVRFLGKFDKTV